MQCNHKKSNNIYLIWPLYWSLFMCAQSLKITNEDGKRCYLYIDWFRFHKFVISSYECSLDSFVWFWTPHTHTHAYTHEAYKSTLYWMYLILGLIYLHKRHFELYFCEAQCNKESRTKRWYYNFNNNIHRI